MNVEIGTEAAHFPAKEYINGIFLAVWCKKEEPEAEVKKGPDLNEENIKVFCQVKL
jgi:hypothetical protein